MKAFVQKNEIIEIMTTMDECLYAIKRALDKLEFEKMTELIVVLTEAFLAVNATLEPSAAARVGSKSIKIKLEYDRKNVNKALEEVLATYDNHDLNIRYDSYENLRSSMLMWTGHAFETLQLD